MDTVGAQDDDALDGGDGDPAEPPRALPLVLAIVAMVCIPLGLIVLFLAFTGETDDAGTTNLTPVEGPPSTGQLAVPAPMLAGRWNVLAGPDSWVGYRAEQSVPRVPNPVTVTGRTTDVTGGLVIDGQGRLVAVALNVDLTTLASSEPGLDDRMRDEGLQTGTFPNATFVLTEPVDLPRTVVGGTPFTLDVSGDLTLHGVTRPVTLTLQSQLVPTDPYRLEMAGDIDLRLSDFDVPLGKASDVGRFADDAAVQLHLVFTRVPDEVALNVPDHGGGTATPATAPPATSR